MKFVIFILCLVSLVLLVSGQAPCQSNFLTALTNCLVTKNISADNFLYIARDGKNGKAPDDPIGFMNRLCLTNKDLSVCLKAYVDNVMQLPEAQCNSTQKAGIVTLYKGFFKSVSKKCEHPCRSTFKESLTKCYTDFNFKLSDYFLFSPTAARDYIMGTNKTDVQYFCGNRTAIIQCMRTVNSTCQDSSFLLNSYGLDIDSLNETYTNLCNYSAIYLESTKCYEFPTNPVLSCRSALATRISPLDGQLDDFNITELQYLDEQCRARLDQIQCESEAMKLDNKTDKCVAVVAGLHRQMECQLLPKACKMSQQGRISTMCRDTDYLISDRDTLTSRLNSSGKLLLATELAVMVAITTVLMFLV